MNRRKFFGLTVGAVVAGLGVSRGKPKSLVLPGTDTPWPNTLRVLVAANADDIKTMADDDVRAVLGAGFRSCVDKWLANGRLG